MIRFPLPGNLKSLKYDSPSNDARYVNSSPSLSISGHVLTGRSRGLRSVLKVQEHMVTDCKNAALYIPLQESHDEISRYPSQAAPSREPSPVVRTPKQVRVKKIRTNHSARVIHRISTDEHERRSLCMY